MEIKKHFVVFYSPGTFVCETSKLNIDSWDVDKAVEMSYGVKERHGALPFAFKFFTYGRKKEDLNSKVIDKSPMYYLGGNVYTLEEIKAQNNPEDRILISNMECNNIPFVIVNTNSWKHTCGFYPDKNILLEYAKR